MYNLVLKVFKLREKVILNFVNEGQQTMYPSTGQSPWPCCATYEANVEKPVKFVKKF